jgi:adenylylsulfate kinase-like enzyme
MIAELLAKIGLFVLDLFISDQKKKYEYSRKIMAATARWDREAIKSSELRDMFDRIEKKMKEAPQ